MGRENRSGGGMGRPTATTESHFPDNDPSCVADLGDRLVTLVTLRNNCLHPMDTGHPVAQAILSPRSANRHDAGCRGAGANRVAAVIWPKRSHRLPQKLRGRVHADDFL